MRALFPTLAATIAIAMAGSVSAKPSPPVPAVASVDITIGPDLQKKAQTYGQREFDYLSEDLRRDVTNALTRSGALNPEGGRLELVISDAIPSRPTMAQLGATPGLSMISRGVGGATITGRLVTPNGEQPVSYKWYETDLRNQFAATTWSDTQQAFQLFASRLAKGQLTD